MRLSSALLLGAAAGAASSVQAAPLGFADFEARGSAALDAGFVAVARDLSAVARSCLEASGVAVTYPGDSAFSTQSQPENSVLPYTPAAIAAPASADEVASVTRCVAAQNGDVKVVPKSGGHSYTSASLGGQNGSVVIDLKQHLTAITIDADAKTATVQAGATLGPLAQALGEKGFALPHGTCPTVGVGGHSLGGGWGFTSRSWGWLLDHIVSMQLVTPDGSIKSVNATSEPDLFWALRGAGASNFGTVTEFTYSLEDAPESVVNYSFTYPSNDDCVQLILAVQ
jgi:FAD/FMN-containing dehydrogenase